MTGGGDAGGGWRRWVVTLGGAGVSPVGPGTVGSLVTTLLLGAFLYGLMSRGGTVSPVTWNVILVGGIFLFGGLCVGLGRWTADHFGRKDPGQCVLDEAAGICLTALFVPIYPGWRAAWALVAVFAAFRVFDILKPPPAKRLERLPGGWGILVDDLAAAVYANAVCQVIVRWVIA